MQFIRHDARRRAGLAVATWFANTGRGMAFLDGKGGVFAVSDKDADAMRDEAETEIADSFAQLSYAALAAAGLLVAFSLVASAMPDKVETALHSGGMILKLGLLGWLGHQVIIAAARQKACRARFALRFRGRAPMSDERSKALMLADPVAKVFTWLMAVLFVGNFLAHLVTGNRPENIEGFPLWIVPGIIVFILIAGLGSWWIDRSRGIGEGPKGDQATDRFQDR